MTVLAYQLRNQKKSASIMKINRTDLYYECLKTKQTFEMWPEWIQENVTRMMLNDIYKESRKRKARREKNKLNKRKSFKAKVLGKFNMEEDYFN